MIGKKCGTQTVVLSSPPSIISWANAAGKKEGDGPLSAHFDYICPDDSFGEDSWEKSESAMQKLALSLALEKSGQAQTSLDWLFAGDLLNQCVSSSFAARDQNIPFFGLYGACSTMGEGLALASMLLDGGFGAVAGVVASSHFCSAERQYRSPLEYGGQRPPTTQWTVTASGAAVLSREGTGPYITHVTPGKIVDKGVTDTNNMGAAMAPAAYDTIKTHFQDTGRTPQDYDLIVTGDLGRLGSELLEELFNQDGVDLRSRHTDCGLLIFDDEQQDVHCGGSGCGCAAAVLTGYLLGGLQQGVWTRILFCPTGALHSPTTAFQGESIPGICHAIVIDTEL